MDWRIILEKVMARKIPLLTFFKVLKLKHTKTQAKLNPELDKLQNTKGKEEYLESTEKDR